MRHMRHYTYGKPHTKKRHNYLQSEQFSVYFLVNAKKGCENATVTTVLPISPFFSHCCSRNKPGVVELFNDEICAPKSFPAKFT